MKRVSLTLLVALLAPSLACELLSDVQDAGSHSNPILNSDVDDVASGFETPSIFTGRVRVRVLNEGAVAADVRVTMRIAGQLVHRSSRRVPALTTSTIVGADHADSVLIEATQLTVPEPRSLLPASFFLGLDFQPGDTLDFRIAGDPPVIIPEPRVDPPPPVAIAVLSGSDTIAAVRVDPNQFFNLGAGPNGVIIVPDELPPPGGVSGNPDGDFTGWTPPPPGGVTTIPGFPGGGSGGNGGNTDGDPPAPAPTPVSIVIDIDLDPTNGNESLIPLSGDREPGDPILWTPGDNPGLYTFYIDQAVDGGVQRVGPGPTAVRVNIEPSLTFDSPLPGTTIIVGDPLIIGWAGTDDDDNARIAIFLDADGALNGNEIELAEDVSEDDLDARTLVIDSSSLIPGAYYIAGTINDGLAQSGAWIGPIELVAKP